METTAIERIRKIIDNERLSVEAFAGFTSISKNTLDSMFKKKTNPSFENLTKIITSYPKYSTDWLLTGKGQMLKQDGGESFLRNEAGVKYAELSMRNFRLRVPFVSARLYGNYIKECDSLQFVNSLDEIDFVVDELSPESYVAFEMKGDSMDDGSKYSICDRDVVLARRVAKADWDIVLNTKMSTYWILVLKNAIVCKEVVAKNVDKKQLTCHSLNPSPEYADFTLGYTDVVQLYVVVAKQSACLV